MGENRLESAGNQYVAGPEEGDPLPSRHLESLVPCVVDACVRLAAPEIDLIGHALEEVHCAVPGAPVDYDDLRPFAALSPDALDRLAQPCTAVQHTDYDCDHGRHSLSTEDG